MLLYKTFMLNERAGQAKGMALYQVRPLPDEEYRLLPLCPRLRLPNLLEALPKDHSPQDGGQESRGCYCEGGVGGGGCKRVAGVKQGVPDAVCVVRLSTGH